MHRSAKTAKVLRAHVRRRALERFGWELTTHEMEEIVSAIKRGNAQLVDRQSLNVTRYLVKVRDRWVGTAYDKQRKMIRTIFPKEFFDGQVIIT
jgi:hypothetical protein